MITNAGKLFARVSYDFVRLVDARLITFVRNVITLLGGLTAIYSKPQPPLATMTTAVNTFDLAVQTALNGGKIEIGARNAARAEVLSLTRQLAAFVQGNCLDDVQNIIATGFSAVRGPSPAAPMTPPQNQRLEYTDMSGEMRLTFRSVPNARNYSIQTATTAEGPWVDHPLSTSVRVVLPELAPGKVIWARARANGAAGTGEWGGPATTMVI